MSSQNEIRRFAILGNHLPRQCGIATFTTHLADALVGEMPGVDGFLLAMNDHVSVKGRLAPEQHNHVTASPVPLLPSPDAYLRRADNSVERGRAPGAVR